MKVAIFYGNVSVSLTIAGFRSFTVRVKATWLSGGFTGNPF